MLGTENLKKVLAFALGLGNELAKGFEDGKLSLVEGMGLADNLLAIPGLISARKEILAELKDLDAAERQELFDYVKQEFDLPDDRIEAIVEEALGLVENIVAIIYTFQQLKKA